MKSNILKGLMKANSSVVKAKTYKQKKKAYVANKQEKQIPITYERKSVLKKIIAPKVLKILWFLINLGSFIEKHWDKISLYLKKLTDLF